MHSGHTRLFSVVLPGAAAVLGLWIASISSNAVAQPPANAAAPAEKELEVAAARAREGKVDEALGIIKEKAAKHPDWPPARLILARLLFNASQAALARHALEQAAAEAPNDPEVYLTQGGIALGEGRISDARLNFDKMQSLVASGHLNAEKTMTFRREALAGLATVEEARENWKAAQERLNAWLALEPKNGRVRQRLGRALFQLGKADDAFAAFTQAIKDEPALEPAAVSMALLQSRKGDFTKAEEWFDYARKLEPKNARVRVDHARWLLDQGRADNARAEIDEALRLGPPSKDAHKIQALDRLVHEGLRRRRSDPRAAAPRRSRRLCRRQFAGTRVDRARRSNQAVAWPAARRRQCRPGPTLRRSGRHTRLGPLPRRQAGLGRAKAPRRSDQRPHYTRYRVLPRPSPGRQNQDRRRAQAARISHQAARRIRSPR